jgi:hypothetical protein
MTAMIQLVGAIIVGLDRFLPDRLPRMQFSLLALLAVLTIVCVVLAWFSRPPRVMVFSYLLANEPVGSITAEDSSPSANVTEHQLEAARSLIQSDEFVEAILSNPSIAQLAIIRNRPEPARWLQDELSVEFNTDVGAPAVSIVVRASQQEEGRTLVEFVTEEYVTRKLEAEHLQRQQRRGEIAARLQEVSRAIGSKLIQLKEVVSDRGREDQKSLDLQREFTQLQSEARSLSVELEDLDVEASAPVRIRRITGTTIVPLSRW